MKKRLYIEGRRNGYEPEQCGRTMTIADLIAFLEDFDYETEIFINNDNGYTYGNIDDCSFEYFEEDEDDEDEDEEEE